LPGRAFGPARFAGRREARNRGTAWYAPHHSRSPAWPPISTNWPFDQVWGQDAVPNPEAGFRYGFQYSVILYDRSEEQEHIWDTLSPGAHLYRHKVKVVFPDGGEHEFRPYGNDEDGARLDFQGPDAGPGYTRVRPDGYIEQPAGQPEVWFDGDMTYYSVDGTYLRLVFGQPPQPGEFWNCPWTLYLQDGTIVTGVGSDTEYIYHRTHSASNPNYIKIDRLEQWGPHLRPATLLTDRLGRSLVIENAYYEDYLHLPGVNGQDVVVTVHKTTVEVDQIFRASTNPLIRATNGGSLPVFQRIDLPPELTTGGSSSPSYVLTYYAGTEGWGQLKTLTTPTGVTTEYWYALNNLFEPTPSSIQTTQRVYQKQQRYDQRHDLNDDPQQLVETWLFGGGIAGTSSTTDPALGVVTDYLYLPGNGWRNKLSYKTEYPDGKVVERIWARALPYGLDFNDTRQLNPYVKSEFTTVVDPATGTRRTAARDFTCDANGNVTSTVDYDWVDYSTIPRDGDGRPTGGLPGNAAKLRETARTFYYDPGSDSDNTYNLPSAPKLLHLVKSVETRSGTNSVPISRTEFQYDNTTDPSVGNLTEEKTWNSNKNGAYRPLGDPPNLSGSNSETVGHQYDGFGNRTWTTDARLYQTKYEYGAINGFTGLYPTRITTGYGTSAARVQEYDYEFSTGLVTCDRDADNQVWTTTQYDKLGRPTLISAAQTQPATPAQSNTSKEYAVGLGGMRIITRSDLDSLNDQKLVSVDHYDPLGRIRLHRVLEIAGQDPTNEADGIKVQGRYMYSGNRRYQLVSNPYRAANSNQAGTGQDASTMGWTLTTYDQAGRVVSLKSYSGFLPPSPWQYGGQSNGVSSGEIVTSYAREFLTQTDQAGKQKRTWMDAMGRVVRVDEPNTAGQLGTLNDPTQATYYTYDALDSLRVVQQGGQTRYFCYDSRNLLIRAYNVEQAVNNNLTWTDSLTGRSSWSMSYLYDGNGNLIERVDARNVTTAYSYDPLNRLTARSYSDSTPANTYIYGDTQGAGQKPLLLRGRLLGVDAAGVSLWENLAFDAAGRVTQSRQTTATGLGAPLIWAVMSYTYDCAGDLTSATYPSGRTVSTAHDSAGRISSVRGNFNVYAKQFEYEANGAIRSMLLDNDLYEQRRYNERLQARQIGLGQYYSTSNDLSSGDANRLLLGYQYGSTGSNNGNVSQQTITIPGKTYTQAYTYDTVNRLYDVHESENQVPSWSQTFTHDRYGNLAQSGDGVFYSSVNYDANTNRVLSYVIPDVGTLVVDHDAAGNIKQGTTYTYDAENRVTSYNGNTYAYDGEGRRVKKVSGGITTIYAYDVQGQLISEYSDATPSPVSTLHLTADHLGSTRVVTDKYGSLVSRHDYRPFGQELLASGSNPRRSASDLYGLDSVRQKFTGKERDPESGLDYFGARYYWNSAGRFTSVDIAGPRLADPQSLDRFSYTRNNPLTRVDPDGLADKDVHTSLTWGLAEAAGFSSAQAFTIATADQAVDDNPATGPHWGITRSRRQANADWHFPSEQRLNDLAAMTTRNLNEVSLGQYLHASQDSFFHAGYTDMVWGHALRVDPWAPDKTWERPDLANRAAHETYLDLAAAKGALSPKGTTVPWSVIAPYVDRFNRADSPNAKSEIGKAMREAILDFKRKEEGRRSQ